MSDITLSAGVRQNLLSLQNTSDLMAQTQNRLATGKEVNSALDNPSNFFTSESLQSRANDMSSLLDSMANGVKTLEAADNGLQSITKTLESMESTLRQARQDKSFQTESYKIDLGDSPTGTEDIEFTGGAVGDTAVTQGLTDATGQFTGSGYSNIDFSDGAATPGYAASQDVNFDVAVNGGTAQSVDVEATDGTTLSVTVDGGSATTYTVADATAVTADEFSGALNAAFDANDVDVTSSTDGGELVLTADTATDSSDASVDVTNVDETGVNAGSSGLGGGSGSLTDITAKTVDSLVTAINNNSSLDGKIRASNDDGQLRIENQSTQELTVTGVNGSGDIDGGTGTGTIDGNSVRSGLADQFNELKDQLDKLSDDASYNGINLLRGDNLKITFNETGTSTIDIQTEDGETINSANLGLESIEAQDLDSDANIDGFLQELKAATDDIASQSSTFGSNLSIVENRQDFTKNMVNTLETGSDNLVLADMNQEAANMMALQTRQQLSSSALSLASQADQNVLQLLR